MSEQIQAPAWYQDYQRRFLASEAHCFTVYGDIHGLAYENMSHRGYLIAQLAARRSVILCYDVARGITFPDEAMRENAITLLQAASDTEPAEEADPFTRALAGVTGDEDDEGPKDPFRVDKPLKALRVIDRLLQAEGAQKQVAIIIDHIDAILPPMSKATMQPDQSIMLVLLQILARDSRLAARNIPIFLLTRSLEELHPDLRRSSSGIKAVEIAYPDYEARAAYLEWYLSRREQRGKAIPLVELDRDELARVTAGLSLRNLEDVLLLGAKEGGVTRLSVKSYKDAIIASENTETAEMLEPLEGGFSAVGGMEKLKAWFTAEIIQPVRLGHLGDVPKGVLLAGPPGTGKTFIVKALAREVGFNAVALNLENILGSYLGESERKLKEFFNFCRSMAPVLVFLDELDQSDVSRRGTGSGNPAAANLFSAMLRFMGDETLRGRVVWMFASNRPDLIDSALLRSGRIDAIIPVKLPNEAARRDIVIAQAHSQQIQIDTEAVEYLAAKAIKYSAADLAKIVGKARKLTMSKQPRIITQEEAARAFHSLKPSSPTQADWYTMLAINACTDTDLLEPDEVALKDNPAEIRKRIKTLKPEEFVREEREE
ncbi:MAG: ATP-binding protein [Ktedonobacteraceae bacterium]